jgi:hypothetical protein
MASLKNTVIDDTGNVTLPTGTSAQRPGSPIAGQFRFNTSLGIVEAYTGGVNQWVTSASQGVLAAGGTVYDVDVNGTTYRVHTFTTTGTSTFTVGRPGTVEYLIVAGGGGGGRDNGGGGGAGGLLTGFTTVSSQTYTITVGAGGLQFNVNFRGFQGGNSSAFGLTAIGGGGGGGGDNGGSQSGTDFANSQLAGGSGGSGGGGASEGGNGAGGSGTAGQGNSGGAGLLGSGGGGGGAGEVGKAATAANSPGNGGAGISSIISGTLVCYAGGGGGAPENSQTMLAGSGLGGLGGGGRGNNPGEAGFNGTPNSGGGGGGGQVSQDAGNGGSGIVIIRYPLRSNFDNAEPKETGNGLVLDLDFSKPTVYAGAGTIVNDSSLNGITGTLVNSPVFTDARTQRSSFRFNGTNSTINTNNQLDPIAFGLFSEAGAAWSVSNWFLPNPSNVTAQAVTGKGGGNGPAATYIVWTEGTLLRTRIRGGDILDISTSLQAQWYEVTTTWDGTVARAYLNGQFIATIPIGAAAKQTNSFCIGSTASGGNSFLDGNVAVVKVFNQALSAQRILDYFNATRWRFGV